ncbi:peptide chain release factor N(5)-glutamine methyltransferase [Micromonospora sp. WMMD1102]|uniref:peptide chain release factor N(5)-glutamine methyltransferase n=1 Tax=Micromonospora sp. WMMD1102 TaxID=3016105 RepID=UPI002414DEFD|nr:peptide chain release factor N(5)-glutamine methyltransferase [Micromonospora sp. WMMD1102]MDG4789628.1 peptide chain release factor N(5)-glutamine methyltransferase [Micromonospora sp. WMMD1102]
MPGHPPEPPEPVRPSVPDRVRPSVALAAAASALAGAGVGPARVEAELLLGYVLGVSRGALAVADPLTPEQQGRLAELVRRRTRHEPLQHLLGSAAFRYLELAVGPGVFVPRPETELLAGWGIEQARRLVQPEGGSEPLVVDLCSGSGAIALSAAGEVPRARVVAVERAAPALDWLRRNAAERAGAGDRPIEVLAGDVADPELLAGYAGRVDVLLCNPPYVPDGTPVPPDVAGHDPADAVFGGPDGLAVIRLLLPQAARLLRPGGLLGIEHDDTHGTAVPELLRVDGRFVDVADHPDLVGRPRFATARRAGTPG